MTITEAGVYRLSGTLEGKVVVAAPEDATVALLLGDATITSSEGAAIDVQSADDVALVAESGTSTLTDSQHRDEDGRAAVASEEDLTIAGDAKLVVNGTVEDGISSDDDLAITASNLTVTAADDALRGKDSVAILGGQLTLEAGGHGIASTNDEDEGRGFVTVSGGTLQVSADQDGINATTDVTVNGGTLTIDAGDDTINASGDSQSGDPMAVDESTSLEISGGVLSLTTGGDGIDSNGTGVISGGEITVDGPESGANSMIDVASGLEITGGTLFAVGADGMSEAPSSNSTQGWVSAYVSGQAGDTVTLTDADGNEIASHDAGVSFSGVLVSTPEIRDGESYTVSAGESSSTATAGQAQGGQMGPGQMGAGQPGGQDGMPADMPRRPEDAPQ